jgi:hypothetical protein
MFDFDEYIRILISIIITLVGILAICMVVIWQLLFQIYNLS